MYRNRYRYIELVQIVAATLGALCHISNGDSVVPPQLAFACDTDNVTLSCDLPADHVVSVISATYGQDKSDPCMACNTNTAASSACTTECLNSTDLADTQTWMTCLRGPVCVLSLKDIFSASDFNPCETASTGGKNYLKVVFTCIKPDSPAQITANAALAVTIGPILAIAIALLAIIVVAFLFYHSRQKARGRGRSKPRDGGGAAAVPLNSSPAAHGSPEKTSSPSEPLKPYDPENIPYVDDSQVQVDD